MKPKVEQVVVIVIGMPGSGKTTACKQMMMVRSDEHWAYVDNTFAGNNLLNFHALLNRGMSIVTCDIQFCNADTLNLFLAGLPEHVRVVPHYFANDPEACKANVRRRCNDRMIQEIEKIRRLTLSYQPVGPIKPVWKPGK